MDHLGSLLPVSLLQEGYKVNYSGFRFGHYLLERPVGRGGFADVYEAWDLHLARRVAVKVLRKQLAPLEQQQFLREARFLAHLNHPHIVRIMEFDMHNDVPYCVMDYAAHGSLSQRHPFGEILPLKTIVCYVRQIVDALDYLHQQNLVHLDIKPQNLLLGQKNEVLLADFGIATLIKKTQNGDERDIVGTTIYMAPERFEGIIHHASDQYSLAVIVYEWLTGEALFSGSTQEIIQQHLHSPIPVASMKKRRVPRAVRQLLLKALAKKPEDRFESVRAFATALAGACLDKQATIWKRMVFGFSLTSLFSLLLDFVPSLVSANITTVVLIASLAGLFISALGALLRGDPFVPGLVLIGLFDTAVLALILHSWFALWLALIFMLPIYFFFRNVSSFPQ